MAREYLVFEANLGRADIPLDQTAPTAHGSGGAADVFVLDSDGTPVNLGVPFDSTSPAALIDYFESATLDEYQELQVTDPGLRLYLEDQGVDRVDVRTFEAIRDERRILFWAMREVGATFFFGEPWHFNFSNEDGGKQAAFLPGAGNTCQSLLRNVRDPQTGACTAVWGNSAAHTMATKRG